MNLGVKFHVYTGIWQCPYRKARNEAMSVQTSLCTTKEIPHQKLYPLIEDSNIRIQEGASDKEA